MIALAYDPPRDDATCLMSMLHGVTTSISGVHSSSELFSDDYDDEDPSPSPR